MKSYCLARHGGNTVKESVPPLSLAKGKYNPFLDSPYSSIGKRPNPIQKKRRGGKESILLNVGRLHRSVSSKTGGVLPSS